MAQFDSALPPGLAGWAASQQLTNQTNQANLANVTGITGLLAKLQAAQKEQDFRGALSSAQTPDEQLKVASRYMGPDALGKMIQGSQDRRAIADQTKQIAMARLGQTLQKNLSDLSFKERAATTAEEKFHWQQQMDAIKAAATKQAADIAAGRFNYDVGTPIEPFRGVVPQPGITPAPASPTPTIPPGIQGEPAALQPALTAASAPGAPPFQMNVGNYNPARQVDISGTSQQPMPQPQVSAPAQPVAAPLRAGPVGNQDMRDLQSQLGPRPTPAIASQLGPQPAPIESSALTQPNSIASPTSAIPSMPPEIQALPKRKQAEWLLQASKTAAEQGKTALSPVDLTSAGAQIAAGMPVAQAIPGFGAAYAAPRNAARAEAIRQIKEQNPGMTDQQAGTELANRNIDFVAGKRSVTQLNMMLGATRQAVDQLDFNVTKATEAMKKLGTGGVTDLSPVINAIARGEQKWTGNPAYSELFYFMFASGQESARILSGGQASVAQLYEGAAREAKQWADANMTTPKAWMEGVAPAMLAEGHERLKTYERAIEKQRLGMPASTPQRRSTDTTAGASGELAIAKAAIAAGAPRDAVAARYKQRTGEDLP